MKRRLLIALILLATGIAQAASSKSSVNKAFDSFYSKGEVHTEKLVIQLYRSKFFF